MGEKREEIGMISGINVGLRDIGRPVLWFGVNTISGESLQVLEWDEAAYMLKQYEAKELADLEGRACIVETDGQSSVYKRAFK